MIVLYLALAPVCGFVAGFLVCWLFVRSTIEKIEALFERCKIAEEPDDPRLAALLDRYKDVEWTALREELRAGDPH